MKTTNAIFFFAALAAALFLIAGCDKANHDPFVEQIVLQGDLNVGGPLMIRLTRTLPMGVAYNERQVGVSDADVRIWADEHEFVLREEDPTLRGSGYYSLPLDSHTVTPGVHYAIRAGAGSDTLRAETRAVGPMHITGQNRDTLMYYEVPWISINWDRDSLCAGYWVIVESLDPDWQTDKDIKDSLVSGNSGASMLDGNFSYWNVVAREDSVALPWIFLCFPGLHRVVVRSCDQPLWDFSYTYQPNQTDVQPITNVRGGRGIFTAGGADTTYFFLTKNPDLEHGMKH